MKRQGLLRSLGRDELKAACRAHGLAVSGRSRFDLMARLLQAMAATCRRPPAPAGSRRELAVDPVFSEAFIQARKRIREMDVRWVAEIDPLRQALLEIYVSVVLGTLNEFRNH